MRRALYRRKSLPSVDMSRKRRERGGKPLTKKLSEKPVPYVKTLYGKRSYAISKRKQVKNEDK